MVKRFINFLLLEQYLQKMDTGSELGVQSKGKHKNCGKICCTESHERQHYVYDLHLHMIQMPFSSNNFGSSGDKYIHVFYPHGKCDAMFMSHSCQRPSNPSSIYAWSVYCIRSLYPVDSLHLNINN